MQLINSVGLQCYFKILAPDEFLEIPVTASDARCGGNISVKNRRFWLLNCVNKTKNGKLSKCRLNDRLIISKTKAISAQRIALKDVF